MDTVIGISNDDDEDEANGNKSNLGTDDDDIWQ